MKASKILKIISGALEALLGIPVLGGTIILALAWIPLGVMFLLHIATLVLSGKDGVKKHGSILGIVTSCIGWIPFVGMIMHIITAVMLLVDGISQKDSVEVIKPNIEA
ncbi:hypothetical protein EV207_103115 [Scopulibacillus darangshiensis]|uniref:Uncharacterized protein n=1 Tax=Scopulibacillus darangshiensis TaxID=442528 RepID=A0A4R2P8H4_9BACL|nr:hypothetical protein [Scopulibacillus darangshiensis]TCP31232.1 hypothetical protein EV207_103115 [Scopulibacillus darangshiensis]